MAEITDLLLQTQNHDPAVRNGAEAQLNNYKDQNFAQYVLVLATELSTPSKPIDARQIAGLVLKNLLDAKEEARKQDHYNRWLASDAAAKAQVRKQLLDTLADEQLAAAKTAALVIAKVASIDLPKGQWPELIGALLNNMTQTAHVSLRQFTLEALGYVCEEMAQKPEDVLTPEQVNMILTAVVQGMRKEEPSADVRLAATRALSNAVEFAAHNFDNDSERNFIMQVVCDATNAPDLRVRTAAFQCLHQIAAAYYQKLPPYIEDIYKITHNAIMNDPEDVALQAVEFWSTICDCELEATEAPEEDLPCHNFISQVAEFITPTLLLQLTKQDEEPDQGDGSWNMAMASGTCLGLMARVAGNAMIPRVIPYVQMNIAKSGSPEDWRHREAATFAFGSILEGPERGQLLPICQQALNPLFQALKDPHPHVRDTTAWTISRMFEFLHSPDEDAQLVLPQHVAPVVNALMESLQDQPHIAYHVCCAISHLAAGYQESDTHPTSPLSPFFNELVASLLKTAGSATHSIEQNKLQVAAFEAINDLVRTAALDTLEIVAKLIQVLLERMRETLAVQVPPGGQAAEKQAEVQGQLCGTLQVVIQKLSDQEPCKAAVLQFADQIMRMLLSILASRSGSVHEEAMLAVGAFTYTAGPQFVKYMPEFAGLLKMGLQNHQEWQVCLSTVGVLGDVCRNIESQILPYCDELIAVLMHNLASEEVNRSVKPQILSTFGDLALATEDGFIKYLDHVKRLLQQAMHLSVLTQQQAGLEEDILDYNTELRIGIFEAYSGIFNGLSAARCEEAMRSEVGIIVEFIGKVAEETDALHDETLAKNAINLLGDICSKIPSAGQVLKHAAATGQTNATAFLQMAQQSGNSSLLDQVEWAINQVQAAMANA